MHVCVRVCVYVFLVHTKESEPVTEQHGWAQVVYKVQIREGPSSTIIL